MHFKITRANPPLLVPSTALLIDGNGTRVALVEGDGTLRYQPVKLGRDYGSEVEVVAGLETSDVVATGLPPNLADGSRVDKQAPPGATPPVAAGKPAEKP